MSLNPNPKSQSVFRVLDTIFPIRPIVANTYDEFGRPSIPDELYRSLWLERLFNRTIRIYRNDDNIFYWPAGKMKRHNT